MRKYECFFIVNPELSQEALTSVDDKIKGIVESNGGRVVSYVPWGKKKLAYPVKKRNYGLYILMEFASGPDLVTELERNLRLDERVLKFITVKLDDAYDPEQEEAAASEAAPVAEAEGEEKAAAEEEAQEVAESAGEEEVEKEE